MLPADFVIEPGGFRGGPIRRVVFRAGGGFAAGARREEEAHGAGFPIVESLTARRALPNLPSSLDGGTKRLAALSSTASY
jgi:hypothetical protein